MVKNVQMSLLTLKPISTWTPIHGDIITRPKIIFGWWGVVTGVDNQSNTVSIARAGDPRILFTLGGKKRESRTTTMDVNDIVSSAKYVVHQHRGNQSIWYV